MEHHDFVKHFLNTIGCIDRCSLIYRVLFRIIAQATLSSLLAILFKNKVLALPWASLRK